MYPIHLHESHKLFPLAPVKRSVRASEWSPTTLALAKQYGIPIKDGAPKLLLTLEDKENYIPHYAVLQFYLSQGMILKKVHKVLTFRQSRWMRDFVLKNTQKRKEALSDFDRDLWKLTINSLYGKTLQSNKNKIDFRLVTDRQKFMKLSSQPTFKNCQVINSGLVGVSMKQPQVELTHILYTGTAILDLSKMHLYKFHYRYLLPMYGEDLTVLMSDTDSILISVRRRKNQCPYDDIARNMKMFDTSNYRQDDPAYSIQNKKKLGCIKEEGNGRFTPYIYYCGLQSKVYTLEQQRGKDVIKAKGIKRSTLKTFTAEDYEDTLHNPSVVKHHTYHAIRSLKNQLFTVKGKKKGITSFDDKFFLMPDMCTVFPYGYYKLNTHQTNGTDGE
mgnify:FL=1